MRIELKPFSMSRRAFFRILLTNYFSRRWWVYLAVFLLGVPYFWYVSPFPFWMGASLLGVLPLLRILAFWGFSHSRENAFLFKERSGLITDDTLHINMQDATTEKIKWDIFMRCEPRRKAMLFYLSPNQFVYIPFHAFANRVELQEFLEFCRDRWQLKLVIQKKMDQLL